MYEETLFLRHWQKKDPLLHVYAFTRAPVPSPSTAARSTITLALRP